MPMLIEQVFPAVVGEIGTLRDRLSIEAAERNISNEELAGVLAILPEQLACAGCFLDRMTGIWRYEFGFSYEIGDSLVWGTQMWVPVRNLFDGLYCAYTRLPSDKRETYLRRLGDPDKHQATLAEMAPASRVASAVPLQFEIAGLGNGNRTIDWVVGPHDGRTVLLDVKRRTTDLIRQSGRAISSSDWPMRSRTQAK